MSETIKNLIKKPLKPLSMQERLNSSGLCSYPKNSKTPFLGNISNSCDWVTHLGLKPPQKNFFENISTNAAARGFQSFSKKEGAAVAVSEQRPKFLSQIRELIW